MRVVWLLGSLGACQVPPPQIVPSRAVLEVYMHPNGLSNCVDTDGERWKADASCCPPGFELAGFSVPAVTETVTGAADDPKYKRKLYRHAVCIEMRPVTPAATP